MRKLFIFSSVIGTFIFNEHFKIIDSIMFDKKEDYLNKDGYEQRLRKKYTNLSVPNNKQVKKILEIIKDPKYFEKFYTVNLDLTKDLLRKSVGDDQLIFQTISNIGELDRVCNLLTKRLREWYSYYNPEASTQIKGNERFVELMVNNKIKKEKNSIGADFTKNNLKPIIELSILIDEIYKLRKNEEKYLGDLMKIYCPNLNELTGITIGAKLLEKAGSLRKLSMFPASTIQLLGAEKALFRHLRNKKNLSPKFGILHEHPLVTKAKKSEKGKIARILADKISIATKVDYFKGQFIGNKLKLELEKRFGEW